MRVVGGREGGGVPESFPAVTGGGKTWIGPQSITGHTQDSQLG